MLLRAIQIPQLMEQDPGFAQLVEQNAHNKQLCRWYEIPYNAKLQAAEAEAGKTDAIKTCWRYSILKHIPQQQNVKVVKSGEPRIVVLTDIR